MKTRVLNLGMITLMLIGLFEVQLHAQTNASSLHQAVIAGDLSTIRSLLEADSTLLESKDQDGNTPLIKACQTMQLAAANYLIDKGANVNAKGQKDVTPLLLIRKDKDESFDLIQRLIDKGADVNAKLSYTFRKWTVFCDLAYTSGNTKIAKLLIDHGADINVNDIEGTPLQMIICHYSPQKLELAKLLMERGVKLQEFSYGNTELHLAAIRGCTDMVPLLVKYGADVNALNDYKHTPLYYATKLNHPKTAEAFIAAGADQNAIVEKNFDKPPQLTASLSEGEAYLWCLGLDGYAIKTKNHFLAFNPAGIANIPEYSLANGCMNAEELKEQHATILVSHFPGDFVTMMLKSMPYAHYIVNAKPLTNNTESTIPPYHLAIAHDTFSLGGLKVHTIQAMRRANFMNGPGLGYLVETDGLKICYAGLHACKNDSLQMVKYRKEIDYLKPSAPIDIAILPIKGRHLDIDYEPYLYLIDQLSPKVIYLLSDELVNEEPKKCVKVLQVRNIPVNYPEGGIALGERFHYFREPVKK